MTGASDRPGRRVAAVALVISSWSFAAVASAGSATAGNKEGFHWNRTNTTYAYANVVDRTSSVWPVYQSTVEWDAASRFNATYAGSSCPTSGHCITVDNASYGPNGLLGETNVYVFQNDTAHIDRVGVHFNDSEATDATWRQIAACHELGHAFGVAHRTMVQSCMVSPVPYNAGQAPDGHDITMMEEIYNH
jgi:hypothetical protein